METSRASRSACILAAHRAVESSRDQGVRICHDPYARRFLPPGFTVIGESEIPEATALEMFKMVVPGFHEFFLARTRYIDDRLQRQIDGGLRQLVILGAGYDSRAYRFEDVKRRIRVFEVDQPATQQLKKGKLREMFQNLPDHVTFVPVDFQTDDLEASLAANGYDPQLPTLFIWEGVTMYIDPSAVDDTLAFIARNTGTGSAVIFDYTDPAVIAGSHERGEAKAWLEITRKAGEPLRFGIAAGELDAFLTQRGFHNIREITSDDLDRTYFVGPNAGRASTPILAIAHADIGPR